MKPITINSLLLLMSLGRVFNLDIVSLKMLSCGIIIHAFFSGATGQYKGN